ncbi:MAG: DEAD/DEAH box helicase [Alicyclobacillus herbarius]|uniref:DEAD/DEAH box helicase n=1 Tax=Alicyclobacillus herbarius TaxID=122960 RepID=UPI0023579A98|nr:DEAD/DEAH box helicase [Alicyclobacillus herbarius]MCL6632138.1 DEAD/DEAH box helicase [Alicyclobacillus herbarius]
MTTIHMDMRRLPDGAFWLGPKGREWRRDVSELAMRVFAWDPESEYGTAVETLTWEGQVGFRLTPAQALRYFRTPHYHRHTDWQWTDVCLQAFRWAPILAEALDAGRFRPTLGKPLQTGEAQAFRPGNSSLRVMAPRLSWQVEWPTDNTPPEPLRDTLQAWADAVIWEEVSANPALREALAEVVATRPLLSARELPPWLVPEEWRAAVGWGEFVSPLQPALQLLDPPVDTEPWQLRMVFSAVSDPGRMWTLSQTREDASFPPEWEADLELAEQRAWRWLEAEPWLGELAWKDGVATLDEGQAWRFLAETTPRLTEAGCTVMVPSWWEAATTARVQVRAQVQPQRGGRTWFNLTDTVSFDWKLAIGDTELDEQEFWRFVETGQRLVHLNGQWLVLDTERLKRLRRRLETIERRGLTMMDVLQQTLLDGNGDVDENRQGGVDAAPLSEVSQSEAESEPLDAVHFVLPPALRQALRGLTQREELPAYPVPDGFVGQLRPYQVQGYRWLRRMREWGLGACLADDMGLGKTVQLIAYLMATDNAEGPALIVCPTSVLGNWQRELRQFAPGLSVHVHYGSARQHGQALIDAIRTADVVLTTYTLVQLDAPDLEQMEWRAVCLDEAQNIKNPATKQAQAVRRLSARHRIALTGTPIENRLTELWSIFAFLNPGYLGSLKSFTERFVTPIERHQDAVRTGQLQRLVQPFLLRRMKTDPAIELDLPDKTETREYVHLTAEQAALYQGVLDELLREVDGAPEMRRRGLILAALTRLKLICDHPAVYLKQSIRRYKGRSNKLDRLLEMVEEVRAEGDRCLVFTQFLEVGTLLQQALSRRLAEPVLFLHGSVAQVDREKMIAEFQDPNGSSGVFVLSLRAGGVGLNLTAANHVFHFDRWWNPAVEEQATDRAYRIGQHQHVQVHKFVSLGTLEERIDQMLQEKSALSEHIVGAGEQWLTELSNDELAEMFRLRQELVAD